ncbi:homocysteine biosynthesis protein [Bacteroidota bacterium]
MAIKKSFEEINEKIKKGKAVVLTAEEVTALAKDLKPEEIAKKVDVVTTATFGPMCSSGAFINFGHTDPPMRMEKITLNDVPVCGGIAAVDAYIGCTEVSNNDPAYGGAHLIQELIEGKDIRLKAKAKGTDCYPRKEIDTLINKNTVNEIFMFNPRNVYQNYNVAVNSTNRIKYTYMGSLLPKMRNATYSTSGELSPLLNDPEMRTIGIGTKIFLCGAQGFVAWPGTQFHTTKEKNERGIPTSNAATIAVIGDCKQMNPEFLQAAYYEKYGVSLFIGVGIPIPVLDEDMAYRLSVSNKDIETSILDYGRIGEPRIGTTNYEALRSGSIDLNGKKIRTAPVSSLKKARQIAELLKSQLKNGEFYITQPVQQFPTGTSVNGLKIRNK